MATKYKYIRLEPADNGHKLCYTKCEESDDIKRGMYSEGMPRELVFESNDKAVKAYLKLCEANGQGADVDDEIMAIKGVEVEEEED
jgi:hypothetical protein